MNIVIILALVEIISVVVKHCWPDYAKLLPVVNTAIGVIASLIMKTEANILLALCLSHPQ